MNLHCTKCFDGSYDVKEISFVLQTPELVPRIQMENVECLKCNKCGDTIFTQQQSLVFEERMRAVVFGVTGKKHDIKEGAQIKKFSLTSHKDA